MDIERLKEENYKLVLQLEEEEFEGEERPGRAIPNATPCILQMTFSRIVLVYNYTSNWIPARIACSTNWGIYPQLNKSKQKY